MNKNLKKDLYNFSETPPDKVWANIDAHFNQKSKYRILFYMFTSFAILGMGLFSYFNIDFPAKTNQETSNQIDQKIGAENIVSNINNPKKNNEMPKNDVNYAITKDFYTNSASHRPKKEKTSGISRKSPINNSIDNFIPDVSEDLGSSENEMTEITLDKFPTRHIESEFNPIPVNRVAENYENPNVLSIKNPCPKVSFFAGISARTGLVDFAKKDFQFKSLIENYNLQNQPKPVGTLAQYYNIGVNGGLMLPKGFFVSLGIGYNHYSIKNNSSIFIYPFVSGNFLNTSLVPTAIGNVEFEPTVDDLSANAYSGGTINGTIHQNFGFLNLPLKIGKLFGKKRLKYSLAIGSSLNFKLLENAKFITDLNQEREIKSAGMRNLNASIGIEPGISYRISSNFILNAGLDLNYTITNLSPSNSYTLNNYFAGINIGIRWNSKNCK